MMVANQRGQVVDPGLRSHAQGIATLPRHWENDGQNYNWCNAREVDQMCLYLVSI